MDTNKDNDTKSEKNMTRKEKLRKERLAAEAASQTKDRRQNMFKIVGAVTFVVLAVLAVVIVSSLSSGKEDKVSSDEITTLLKGLDTNGTVLGDPDAPVTLIEYGDLRCPVCEAFSSDQMKDIIANDVRSGDVNVDFRNWTILGPDSVKAAQASLAAREQDKYWAYVEEFYANQPLETEAVSDEFLTEIAEKAGVPDMALWEKQAFDADKWAKEIDREYQAAIELGFGGTPSFAIKAKGQEPVALQLDSGSSVEEFEKAFDQASAATKN